MQALFAGIAILAGVVLGIVVRSISAKREIVLLEQRTREALDALNAMQKQLAQAQSESGSRSGFESLAAERAATISQLNSDIAALRADLASKASHESALTARVSQLEADLNNERKAVPEKVALLGDAKDALMNQFKVLAGDVLNEKRRNLSEANKSEIEPLLATLREQLNEFRARVDTVQTESTAGVTELKTLIGTLGTLNEQLTEEARNLATSLRGSAKVQGDWGEFILRDLLDKVGFRESEQYSFQQSFGVESENGERARSVRTDVVVFLPGGRNLVIDSKVSLTAYVDCVNAADENARKASLKAHLISMRAHIAGLAKAGYHSLPGVESPDFVVMFVPVEPAFLMAIQADGDLWADAYKQGILLVGPTTLLYVIRIINVLWQQERQARNVRDVMKRGAKLYEKFVGFVCDLEQMGENLAGAKKSYDEAYKKLSEGSGNLVRQVEMLKELGIPTTKSLPRRLLDRAGVDQAELALAANADETSATE